MNILSSKVLKEKGDFMELNNSYIFLNNPYQKDEKKDKEKDENEKSADNVIVLKITEKLDSYLKNIFTLMTEVEDFENLYKKKYVTQYVVGNISYDIELIISEVAEYFYLDIIVKGKSKYQIVKCLEEINAKIRTSGLQERYIDIISYDAVSEYYCNKIYPKLNSLERNLRRLLFNIYTVNFGSDYYKATIKKELQDDLKKKVNIDVKEEEDYIRQAHKVSSGKEIDMIKRLKYFFYSLDYSDMQKILFIPYWNEIDENEKTKFLEKHKDLSELSDNELRKAFLNNVPKSDWERFFSEKILINNVEDMIEQLREYRNSIAHFKFFYNDKYDKCNKIINFLNSAIIKAIKITEEKDFIEKNQQILSESIRSALEYFNNMAKEWSRILKEGIFSAFSEFTQRFRESDWKKIIDDVCGDKLLGELEDENKESEKNIEE